MWRGVARVRIREHPWGASFQADGAGPRLLDDPTPPEPLTRKRPISENRFLARETRLEAEPRLEAVGIGPPIGHDGRFR
jgi:hypothetical protein